MLIARSLAQVTGLDLAGRTSTVSCGYRVEYGFSGFGPPVDAGAVPTCRRSG